MSNDLIFRLQQKLVGSSATEPYCVLSRELVVQVIGALRAEPVATEDGWLVQVEKALTATEFRIYRTLYQAQGRPVAANTLILATGRPAMSADSLWVHTRRLRVKLEKHGWGRVETARKVGYFLILPDAELAD